MAKLKYFVAGTDTEVGKTWMAATLLHRANSLGLSSLGLKPIAAGCDRVDGALRNEDALMLQHASSVDIEYDSVNPIALEPAIAPHIALAQAGRQVNVQQLKGHVTGAQMLHPADITLVEGAGGWLVPLNPRETLQELAVALQHPVILVVAMRLGCINHALLSVQAIRQAGLPLAGWIANKPQGDMTNLAENLATLTSLIPAPCLGEVPKVDSPEQAVQFIRLPQEMTG